MFGGQLEISSCCRSCNIDSIDEVTTKEIKKTNVSDDGFISLTFHCQYRDVDSVDPVRELITVH